MKKTLVLAEVTYDLLSPTQTMPQANEEAQAEARYQPRIFGMGWYILQVFQTLKLPYSFQGLIGEGAYGEGVARLLKQYGMNFPRSSQLHGATLSYVDQAGHYSSIISPGCEYDVDLDALSQMEKDSIYDCVLSGAMLDGSTRDGLLDQLVKFAKHLVFVPGTRGVVQDPGVLQSVFALQPVIFVREEELALLHPESKELKEAMVALHQLTNNDVLCALKTGEVYLIDSHGEQLVKIICPLLDDGTGLFETFIGAFLAAKSVACSNVAALRYASAWIATASNREMDAQLAKKLKDELVKLI